MEHVVVIGAGLGGLRTVEQLRTAGFEGRISMVGRERHVPYDRPPLSKHVLSGEWAEEKAHLSGEEELAALGVELYLADPAVELTEGRVVLASGTVLEGDALVVATGSDARRLPGQPEGVHSLRTLDDSLALREALAGAGSLLIVGAGFIGGEVATVALAKGIKVTVLEALPVPCVRAVGEQVGQLVGRLLSEGGCDLRLGVGLKGFVDEHTVELTDGEQITADVILVGVGARAVLDWVHLPEVDAANGLACDDRGRVHGAAKVWALGDAAAWDDEHRPGRLRTEHWTNATEQAAIVAKDILGQEGPPPALPYFWSDQFGLKIQGLGRLDLAERVVPVRGEGMNDGPVKGTVIAYVDAEDRLVGVVGFGAAKWIPRYRPLIAARTRLEDAVVA